MAEPLSNGTRTKRRAIGFMAQFAPGVGRLISCQVPLLTERHRAIKDCESDTLFVLLPGIQDQHFDFQLAGFVAAARDQGLQADLLAVDAHIGYYVRQTILERLREDVIRPARAAGYKTIWLVGTSLGGLGSALYAGEYESDIDGLVLLAPYLGQPSLIRRIDRAGGPLQWHQTYSADGDFHSSLWLWLSRYFENPNRHPSLFLGFGDRDRFAFANGFLAEALPQGQVISRPGGHDWETWQRLWIEFLERYGDQRRNE